MRWTRARPRWRWLLVATPLVALAGTAAWVLAGNLGGGQPPEPLELVSASANAPPSTAQRAAVVEPTPTPVPTSTPAPPPPTASPVRMVIPAIGVDAPISVKGLLPDGVMELPNGPEDVAWYNFTARPGAGSNAVFSGHLDYRNYGPAVFWRLKELQQGDIVEVRLDDGSVLRYRVSLMTSYEARTAPVAEIVGPSSKEVLTLITCGGTFDSASRNYSQRLVVRAERI